ncbi:MAG: Crp/Fnr family transcriptional regulator [Candidatus Bipolaricaulota bacterium]|nr:Crp/Fnr family transcriptional regulator [Candidatus Bipolaricaulota bacterium]
MARMQELARWLSSLEPAAREAVMAQAHGVALPPETEVYAQGDPVEGMYIVLEGVVKELAAEEGCLRLVRLVGPGEVLGAGELFSETVQTMSAVTVRPTRLAWLSQPDLHEIFARHPSALLWVMQQFSTQLGELRSALVETVYVESAARLTRKLVSIAERFGERTPHGVLIDIKLSRDEWAALAGMAPETVSRVLHDLERRGWIALEGRRIRLLEEEKLRVHV